MVAPMPRTKPATIQRTFLRMEITFMLRRERRSLAKLTWFFYNDIHRSIIRGHCTMVEKKIELRRTRARRKKLTKLKEKLARAKTGGDRDAALKKIHRISPFWKEPAKAK